MHSSSQRYVLVFNGEIYNFRTLRSELEKRGHLFRSQSDTEVILVAVTEWGVSEALRRFNGMFAFALWDRQERALYLTRDRFGEKPLYYGWFDRTLVFASELKGLRAHPMFRGDVNRDALALFMRYGYVPTPYCIYERIRKLPAGTVLKLTGAEADTVTSPEAYWSATDTAIACVRSTYRGSASDATNEFECLLGDAVRLRLESDVPLGAFLSGGIDSSTIVALMQRQTNLPVKTFTVGFEEAPYNEAEEAKQVAKHLGTEHTELYVSAAESMAVIPRLPTLYDEPFADSSQIPTFLISSLARRHVTVSLSGDGGDELLAGYNRYRLASDSWRRMLSRPRSMRRLIGRALKAVPPRIWDSLLGLASTVRPSLRTERHVGEKIHRIADVLAGVAGKDASSSAMSRWDPPSGTVLGTTATADRVLELPAAARHLGATERMMLLDTVTYLPDDILVKVDRASMGVSLEARVPFLDHRVAQFCWSLPLAMKVRSGERKWLLRQVLAKHVPHHLVDRPKTGFAVPIGAWLRGPMRGWAEDLLNASSLRAQGFLNPDPIHWLWKRHLSGRENAQDRLWCALMFQSWLDQQRQAPANKA